MTEEKLKEQFAREDAKAINNALQQLSETREGRKFIWWLLKIGGVGQQPFAGNALQTAFNCGILDVGNRLLAEISTFPNLYVKLIQENQDEWNRRDEQLRDARDARSASGDRGYSGEYRDD